MACYQQWLKPNTHRRRDATVELSHVVSFDTVCTEFAAGSR